ncbi:MAG: hypothetical protein P8124_05560, partial [Gammaproteobacteria bacterium]
VCVTIPSSRPRRTQNGLLPIRMDAVTVDRLFAKTRGDKALEITVGLEGQTLTLGDGERILFQVDSFRKHCLLKGLDDIHLTLRHVEAIHTYEREREIRAPWLP